MDLIVDIETVLDEELPGAPGSSFPAPPYWRVVAVGLGLVERGKLQDLRVRVASELEGEREILEKFANSCDGVGRVVGWNSRGFDLPVIAWRCMRHGIHWPWYYRGKARQRYSDEWHLDLMDYLGDYGAASRVSLDLASRLIGLPGKRGVKGEDVARMVAEGAIDRVGRYCLEDVAQTAALAHRLELVRGKVGIVEYKARIEAWAEAVARSSARSLLDDVNMDRLLGL